MRPTDIRHLLFLAAVALAQPLHAQPMKGATPAAPESMVRPDKMKPAPLPPGGTRASTPGTQNEDDLYVGIKRSAGDNRTPVQGAKPLTPQGPLAAPGVAPRPGAGTSPNTGRKARSGGDDELDELEVERRKAQNLPQVGTGAPQPRPGAGTSPNTGSTARPGPSGPLK